MEKYLLLILKQEKDSAKNIIASISIVLVVCMIFLNILYNPFLTIKPKNFFDIFIIPSIVLLILVISTMIITYSFNFYLKQNSKELGLIRLMGYDLKKTIKYYSIKIGILYFIAFAFSILILVIFIPIIQFILYRLCSIKGDVFYYSWQAFIETVIIIILILYIVIFYQIMYINQTSVAGLLKKDNIISSRKISKFLGFSLPNIIYVDLFFIGIIIIAMLDFSGGLSIISFFGVTGTYGLSKRCIPMYLKNIAKKNNNKDYYIINSEVSLFMQQTSTLLVFSILIHIVLPILIGVMNGENILVFYIYNMAYVLLNSIICLCIYKLFSSSLIEKKYYYKKLYRLGWTREKIKQVIYKSIVLYYLILFIISILYIGAVAFSMRRIDDVLLIIFLIIFECCIPFVILIDKSFKLVSKIEV